MGIIWMWRQLITTWRMFWTIKESTRKGAKGGEGRRVGGGGAVKGDGDRKGGQGRRQPARDTRRRLAGRTHRLVAWPGPAAAAAAAAGRACFECAHRSVRVTFRVVPAPAGLHGSPSAVVIDGMRGGGGG